MVASGSVACRAPDSHAPLEPARIETPTPVATARALPDLPGRASDRATRGDEIGAFEMIARELGAALQAADWSEPRARAEARVAVELYAQIAERFELWEVVARDVAGWRNHAHETPHELAFALEHAYAIALRNLGRNAQAREVADALGAVSDWMLIGPFDNERGGGFDVAHPPELAIDLAARVQGKEREVAWRANPGAAHPLSRVVLGQLFEPSQQVVAYLATAIEVARPREVVLSFGSSCAVKVFLNGHEALARKVRRPFHADQDRVVLALQPGLNQLLVKLAVEESNDWVFEARFRELDGRPIRDLAIDAKRAATPTLPWVEPSARPAPSTAEILRALGDARALRALALLSLRVHEDDVATRAPLEAARAANALEPEDVGGLYLEALARAPQPQESREERQVNPHLAALRAVLARDPNHVSALLDLADFYGNENPIPSRVDELSAKALELAPAWPRALHARAAVLDLRGETSQAELLRKRVDELATARTSVDGVLGIHRRMLARGQASEALAWLEEAFARRATAGPVFDRLVAEYVDRDALDEARAALEKLLEGAPFCVRELLETARLLEHAGDLEHARGYVARALTVAPENAAAMMQMARLDVRAGDVAAASARLDEVLAIDPGNSRARRQRELLRQGGGDRFEEPWRRDARDVVAQAPPPKSDEPLVVLDRTSVYRIASAGTESRYEHVVMRAQNQGGLKQLSSYTIAYPDDAQLQVHDLRVLRTDGSVVRATPPRRDQHNGGWRFRRFDLPPLGIGDVVDVEYRVDELEPDLFGEYFGLRYEFHPDQPDPLAPTLRAELVVIAPPDVELHFAERNAQALERHDDRDASGQRVLRWIARDLARPPIESAMPRRIEVAPGVDVTTYASWDAFARWWWHLIEKEFVTSPEMKAKVAELTAGLTTERDKVRAIARFVAQEIRYNSWPFGTHGYQPFSAATIFERRFGDCKDKSILLRQMLAEIGVVAHPVLIDAEYQRAHDPLDVALIEHFDHCIAYLPATPEREGYYLDATADRNPIEYLRADDQGARVLHVDERGGRLEDIPYAPPLENALSRHWTVALDARGNGKIELRDASTGMYGVQLRHQFGGERGDLKKRVAESLAPIFGHVEVGRIETTALEDLAVAPEVVAELSAQGLWTRERDGATLRLSLDPLELDWIAQEPPEERKFPVVLDRPFAALCEIDYTLPAGAKVLHAPPDVRIQVAGLLEYTCKVRVDGVTIHVERGFSLLERRVPLERYAEFRDALRDIRMAEMRTIRIATPPEDDGAGATKEQRR